MGKIKENRHKKLSIGNYDSLLERSYNDWSENLNFVILNHEERTRYLTMGKEKTILDRGRDL